MAFINVTKASKMPEGAHWVIITYDKVSVDTGWNSPSDRPIVEYQAYTVEQEWRQEITALTLNKTPFHAFFASPAKITTRVDVSIDL